MKKQIKVSIGLPEGTDELEAQNALYKATNHHVSGDVHITESFEDSAMEETQKFLLKLHRETYSDLVKKVIEELEREYD